MKRRTWAWPGLALLVVGFMAYVSCTGPTSCPGIGGLGAFPFDAEVGVNQFAATHPNGVRIKLCVATHCSDPGLGEMIRPKGGPPAPAVAVHTADRPRPPEMTLTVTDPRSGRTLIALKQTIKYVRLEPYGKGCGIQYRSYHTLTATGTLVDAPPTSEPK